MAHVHICAPSAWCREVKTMDCTLGICGKPTPHLCEAYEWYGWTVTCLGCGEAYQDGERCERPFRPRWRRDSIRDALARLNKPTVPLDLGGDS